MEIFLLSQFNKICMLGEELWKQIRHPGKFFWKFDKNIAILSEVACHRSVFQMSKNLAKRTFLSRALMYTLKNEGLWSYYGNRSIPEYSLLLPIPSYFSFPFAFHGPVELFLLCWLHWNYERGMNKGRERGTI